MPSSRLVLILGLLLGPLAATGCSREPAAPAGSGGAPAEPKPASADSTAAPAAMPAHATASPAPGAMPPAGSDAAAPAPAAPVAVRTATGAVVETMDAGGGTYLRLDTGSEKIWVATNRIKVNVGDRLVVPLGMPMREFHSDALDRDFPLIYFATSVSRAGATAAAGARRQPAPSRPSTPAEPAMPAAQGLPAGHPAVPGQAMPPGQPAPGGPGTPPAHPPLRAGEITVTDVIAPAPGGHSVADVWAKRATLAGKTVVVRGKVVKFLSGIMGRNWIHLQDGTGSAKTGTNDLTVTTAADARPGDVLTVTGTLAIDKDFGAGYRYGVIVEGAALAKSADAGASSSPRP